jgi:ubiquinone/menaquinone biosynthesis C-methylase UbiE
MMVTGRTRHVRRVITPIDRGSLAAAGLDSCLDPVLEAVDQEDEVSNVRYDQVAEDFDVVRDRRADARDLWCKRVAAYLSPPVPGPIVDIGAGTGIWSRALAEAFAARVVGVEPADGMREHAQRAHPHPSVEYVAGTADSVPLPDESVAAVWASTTIHQWPDLGAAARELRRVLEPGGPVLIRSGYPGRQDEIELFHLFRGAMRVAERWPKLGRVITAFEDAGFTFEAIERVREPTFDTYDEMMAVMPVMRRSDSALVDLDDEAWEKGLAAIERAQAAGEKPWPLGMDLLVLR